MVHRRIISASSGHETHLVGGLTKTVQYPVIIPESPPSYIPDTRRQRMMEENQPSGLNSSWTGVSVRTADGKEEVVDFSLKYSPPSGFVAIEDFMKSHLASYEELFTQIIQALTELEFKTYNHR